MTIDELKAEANKLGYSLVKRPKTEKYLPCICGKNIRRTWIANNEDRNIILVCYNCGLSVMGKNKADAKRKWNEYIRGEKQNDKR